MIAPIFLSFIFLGCLASQGVTYDMQTNGIVVIGTVMVYGMFGGFKNNKDLDCDYIDESMLRCKKDGSGHDLDISEYGSVVNYIKGVKIDGTKEDFMNDDKSFSRASFIANFGDNEDIQEVKDYLQNNEIAGVTNSSKAIQRDLHKSVVAKKDEEIKQLSYKVAKAEKTIKSIEKAYRAKIEIEKQEKEDEIIDVVPMGNKLLALR